MLAEYYIEVLLEGNTDFLNIGIPTTQTLLFLDGLIYLMNEQTHKEKIIQEFEIEKLDVDENSRFMDG